MNEGWKISARRHQQAMANGGRWPGFAGADSPILLGIPGDSILIEFGCTMNASCFFGMLQLFVHFLLLSIRFAIAGGQNADFVPMVLADTSSVEFYTDHF
jgi:hypothetical protein